MKLLNHTLKYLVLLLPLIIGVWAGIFYYNMVDEVEDSLDDGLENYKMLIIEQAALDSSILKNQAFNERNYAIREIDSSVGLRMRDVYKDTVMFMISEEDFEPVRLLTTAFRQDGRYYELKVVSSSLEKDDLIEDLLYSIVWLYLVLLFSVLLINNFVLKRTWTPFYQLLDKIAHFHIEKNPIITPTPSPVKEFQELDAKIGELAKNSVSAYNNQKHFLENAAHELQTPLAISINKLELLAEHEDIPEQHLESIGGIIRSLQRLTRINKALLLLTKIENKQFDEVTPVQLNQLLDRLIEQFEDLAGSRDIRIEKIFKNELTWTLHPDLAAILFTNLLKNAWVHTQSAGVIRISIFQDEVRVENTAAPGSGPLNADRIFERFQKDSSDIQRVGLGLSIVRAICQVSNLDVNYAFLENRHAFVVRAQRPEGN